MRRIISFLTAFAVMLTAMLCFSVTAAAKSYRVVIRDGGDCFTSTEEQEAVKLLQQAADAAKINIAVVTEDDFSGTTPGKYAQKALDELFGADSDSLVLVISTEFDDVNAYDFIDMTGGAFDEFYSDIDGIYDAYYVGKDMGGYYDGIVTFCEYFTDGGAVSVSYKVSLSDFDDVLTSTEQTFLLDVMQDAADDIECNIGVVITSDRGGETPQRYADSYADDNFGFGSNNIVLLFDNDKVSPKHQDWISTMGLATEMYDHQVNAIFDYLYEGFDSNGGDNYYQAIQYFCSYLRNNQDGGWTYNDDEDYHFSYEGEILLTSLLVPLVIAGVVTGIATSTTVKKYSKKAPISARRYMDTSRTRFTQRQDIYLRETTTHVRISSSSGGGGGSRGGGGGRSGGGRGGGGGRSR